MLFRIDYYKTVDLTPDEQNAREPRAKGLWVSAGSVEESTPYRAVQKAKRMAKEGQLSFASYRVRARPMEEQPPALPSLPEPPSKPFLTDLEAELARLLRQLIDALPLPIKGISPARHEAYYRANELLNRIGM